MLNEILEWQQFSDKREIDFSQGSRGVSILTKFLSRYVISVINNYAKNIEKLLKIRIDWFLKKMM